jgi:hypothetical protein
VKASNVKHVSEGGLCSSRGEEGSSRESSPLERSPEDDLRALRGLVDAVIVGVEVYGVTGFERLVSELNP